MKIRFLAHIKALIPDKYFQMFIHSCRCMRNLLSPDKLLRNTLRLQYIYLVVSDIHKLLLSISADHSIRVPRRALQLCAIWIPIQDTKF